MDDGKLSVAVSDSRREFIEEELAAGTYADETEIVEAALELLENRKKLGTLRALIAEGDADIASGRVHAFESAADMTSYVIERSKSRK
jgi:putative addiction module CopG family antidote